ncbi:mechanosensitive ion channel family protein [Hazenella coriacea]|uniref:Small conductance mechanosensitive channel n=1 Tax=Hazenella coriacea TaxID=1179467 RepID=A0A4R3L236_9BACL|nr:mechanosensitive ion channel family protein [Hazenella coriacea]TCS92798.1 small conductance mechanosensitive channel [Hazenella coriacea]
MVSKMIDNPIDFLLIPLGELLIIIVLTLLALRFIDKIIDQIFSLSRIESKKAQTLQKLIKSVSRYAIYFISLLTIMINLGFDPLPVLAGAGILGLAIGFGAQNLVKDIITGFFLIFEGQLEVGDFVQINGKIKGTVEEVGLRITKVREFNQRLHYIANGNISQVTNYNREKMRAIIPITVPYEADLEIVNKALEEIVEDVNEKYGSILVDEPEIMGVTNMDQTGIQFTITALCDPEQYWSLEREMRKISVLILHRYGIQIAYPRSVIYNPIQLDEVLQEKETISSAKG